LQLNGESTANWTLLVLGEAEWVTWRSSVISDVDSATYCLQI
jgi:hypothetical protein